MENILGRRFVGGGVSVEEGVTVCRLPVLFEVRRHIWMEGLKGVLKRLNPDVVHMHDIVSSTAVRVARYKKKLGYRLVYDCHYAYVVFYLKNFPRSIFLDFFKSFFITEIIKNGDAFVAVTDETKMLMNKELGIEKSRIDVIYLGADSDLFKFDVEKREKTRRRLGINGGDVVFIYAGKVIPQKKPHLMLEASAQLVRENPRVKCLIVGNADGDYKEKIEEIVRENGISSNVLFHDAVPNKELVNYYCAADVGVWPAEISMTMIEATSVGLPIIVTKSLLTLHRISNKNGLAYEEGDIGDLRKCMRRLSEDEELRKEMGKRGRELVEKELNWDVIAKQFLEVYQRAKLQ